MLRLPALVFATILPMLAFAQDRDAEEVNRYVLTDAALAKYEAATERLRPMAGDVSPCDDVESANSIAAMSARIDKVPAARAAIQSAGLTTREYLVFSFAVFQAGMAAWSLEQPGGKLPPGVTQASVDFYNRNKAAIEGMKPLDESACEEYAEEEEPVED